MSQKEKIINILKKNEEMTQADLSIELYGDNNHLSNVYASLMSLIKDGVVSRSGNQPSYYSLISDDARSPKKWINKVENKANIPTPTSNEVNNWLKKWDSSLNYTTQEEAINELFQGHYNSNKSLKNIIIKCSVLNDFYSTNIFKVYPVARHILELDIDDRLKNGDISLVNEIANNKISGKEKNFYSFASKYCSHHNQEEYPIYDYYVDQMLRHFRNVDVFFDFDNDDLKNYEKFKNILLKFREFYKLEKFSLKDLDRYLWQAGKEYYPKNYNKKKRWLEWIKSKKRY